MLELGNLGFIDRKENILFVGSSGVGKTHLATAIGIACARARYSTYFISFESLMTQLKKALLENRLEARMKFFAKYKVLIIDEIGYMPIDTDSANLFFQLIAKRYEKHCTLITTNMPFSKWGEIFGSPTLDKCGARSTAASFTGYFHQRTVIPFKRKTSLYGNTS